MPAARTAKDFATPPAPYATIVYFFTATDSIRYSRSLGAPCSENQTIPSRSSSLLSSLISLGDFADDDTKRLPSFDQSYTLPTSLRALSMEERSHDLPARPSSHFGHASLEQRINRSRWWGSCV